MSVNTRVRVGLSVVAVAALGLSAAPPATADPSVIPIGAVQGTADVSPMVGQTVTVQGIVTGDFQAPGQFNGFYIQDAGDGDSATSDGIFIYDRGAHDVSVGDEVVLTGRVSEFGGQTQISPTALTKLVSNTSLPPTTDLTLPMTRWEAHEGMAVRFPQALSIVEYYNFDRYGEITYALDRQWTPTSVADPGDPANSILTQNLAQRLVVDDGRGLQNPTPAIHPNGQPMNHDNYFRGGDTVSNLTGILAQGNNTYRLEPTAGADYTRLNPRPAPPAVIGDLRIASFNVLNYFTTLTSQNAAARGADTPEEFERQQAKIVAAMTQLDADVLGLMEIENNGTAVDDLVDALNQQAGEETYAAISTGVLGDDAITQAFIYQPAAVEPVGTFAAYDFADGKTRPALTQTFRHLASDELVTISVNHFKSKGSACDGDPDLNDGQGNCNKTRTSAAERLASWLAADPTGQSAERTIIMGDLNSYDYEDPIDALISAGYSDMEKAFGGEHAYSYVFNGMAGYLDYALANTAAAADIVDTQSWHINADESDLFDYDTSYKKAAEQALYSPDPYRSSDHDPVVVSLQLGTASPAPNPETSASSQPAPTPSPPPTPSANPSPGIAETLRPVTAKPGLPRTGI